MVSYHFEMSPTILRRRRGPSEHPVGIHRLGRHWLADVPELGNPIALEAKEVDHDRAAIIRLLSHMRMHSDEIAVLQRAQDIEALVRVLPGILLHAGHQRLGISSKERIVMPKTGSDVPGVCLANAAGGRQVQKRKQQRPSLWLP
ncbi:MAG: hypothetical protein ACREUZ_17400 [Burkholderiales bacterium]